MYVNQPIPLTPPSFPPISPKVSFSFPIEPFIWSFLVCIFFFSFKACKLNVHHIFTFSNQASFNTSINNLDNSLIENRIDSLENNNYQNDGNNKDEKNIDDDLPSYSQVIS